MQGLRGEVKLMHDSGDEEALRRLTSLFLSLEGGEKEFRIESLRMQRRTPIMKLSGLEDRNAAEKLIGCDVYADMEESRPKEEGVWLVSDLIGLEIRFAPDENAGAAPEALDTSPGTPGVGAGRCSVKSVIDNPAHDVLEIETGKGIRLLPLVDVFIREIDTQSGFITIIPPNGWLDM